MYISLCTYTHGGTSATSSYSETSHSGCQPKAHASPDAYPGEQTKRNRADPMKPDGARNVGAFIFRTGFRI